LSTPTAESTTRGTRGEDDMSRTKARAPRAMLRLSSGPAEHDAVELGDHGRHPAADLTGLAGQADDELDAGTAGQPASQWPGSDIDQQRAERRRRIVRVGLRSCHRRSPG
jgi:hypothetical protein